MTSTSGQHRFISSIVLSVLITLSFAFSGCSSGSSGTSPDPLTPSDGIMGDGQLSQVLEQIVNTSGVPAVAALFVHKGEVLEKGAAGKRSIDSSDKVTVEDKWHIGSITKSMTSTLAAIQVEKGLISWDTTVRDVFPELADAIRSEYHNVQLDELLSHTGGISSSSSAIIDQVDQGNPELTQQRTEFTRLILNQEPEAKRGEFIYSNGGYIIAGAMLERATDQSWETLMNQQLFATLEMNHSGFGAPGANSLEQHPLGHIPEAGQWVSIPADHPEADNPALYGPAGTVHTTLSDMVPYMLLHLNGAKGTNSASVLTDDSFTKLHTPYSTSLYSLGWTRTESALTHIGSNNRSLAQVILVPELDIALFIAINAADPFSTDGGVPYEVLNEVGLLLKTRFDTYKADK